MRYLAKVKVEKGRWQLYIAKSFLGIRICKWVPSAIMNINIGAINLIVKELNVKQIKIQIQ